MIERIINKFEEQGIKKFYISIFYKKELIKSYFNDLKLKIKINFFEEKKPLGTGGSISFLKNISGKQFIVTNCDNMVKVNYESLINFHNENSQFIVSQFFLWNPIYNLHRLFMLLIIFYFILFQKQTLFTYMLFLSAISQHIVLFLTHPSSRYAYLAWLLTIILFVKMEYKNKLIKSLYDLIRKTN